jgi:hypothetical protein
VKREFRKAGAGRGYEELWLGRCKPKIIKALLFFGYPNPRKCPRPKPLLLLEANSAT